MLAAPGRYGGGLWRGRDDEVVAAPPGFDRPSGTELSVAKRWIEQTRSRSDHKGAQVLVVRPNHVVTGNEVNSSICGFTPHEVTAPSEAALEPHHRLIDAHANFTSEPVLATSATNHTPT